MRKYFSTLLLTLLLLLTACSTQKNTVFTRAYHNLTAHYNVFFNAKTAYQNGVAAIEQKCQFDYANILPLFPYECKQAENISSPYMKRAQKKAYKTIAKHSIKVPPQHLKVRKYDYCKWIDDSYLLIAKADVYLNEIDRAQSTLNFIIDKFKTENTKYDALLWLAKTYILQERYIDAENYLKNLLNNKKTPKRLLKNIYLTFADLYIHSKNYKKAIPYLQKAIKLTHNRKQKALYYFVLAQLYAKTNQNQLASTYFKKVLHLNPSYELQFHAQLYRAITLTQHDNPKQVYKKLVKLLNDPKNQEYKGQIYSALAQLKLKENDTSAAINLLKKSLYSTTNQQVKIHDYLTLAEIYHKQKKFDLTGAFYDSTLALLPQQSTQYKSLQFKAKSFIQLAKNYSIIKLQDSLLRLASLPKNKLNSIIDSIINARQQQQNQNQYTPTYDPLDYQSMQYATGQPMPQSQAGRWYFYNPVLVSRGLQLFRQKWGNRKLEDNWRRKNKAIINNFQNTNFASNNPQKKQNHTNSLKKQLLQQIPLSDSAKFLANQAIISAMFNNALIYENKLQDYSQAIKTYKKLISKYPNNKYLLDEYYHLYTIYKRLNKTKQELKYKNLIISRFPESQYAQILKNPNYINYLLKIQKKADNLLLNTIKLYNNFKYSQVIDSANYALKNFQGSSIIPYMLFLKAKAFGNLGNIDSMKAILLSITKQFSNSPISSQAKKYLTYINKGYYNLNIYKFNPNQPHLFVLFLNPGDNINQTKFKIYTIANSLSNKKNYNVIVERLLNKPVVEVLGFNNLQEIQKFIDTFKSSWKGSQKWLVFSKQNFITFKKDHDLIKYQIFYNKNYHF